MSMPKINLSEIKLKDELNKFVFLNQNVFLVKDEKKSALIEFLKSEYGISENNINCETSDFCTGVRSATDKEIEEWNEHYEETEEFANSYYSYAFSPNGKRYYIHVLERVLDFNSLEVEVNIIS